LQYPWARLGDRTARRVPFIVFGTILSASLFLLIAASASPWQLILVVMFQAIAISMVAPNWSALLGERTAFGKRGRVFGGISVIGGVSSLSGTLLAAFILFNQPQTEAHPFQVPFVIAAIVGVLSALVLLFVKEGRRPADGGGVEAADPKTERTRRADFLYFTKVQAFYNFFMSMAWPLIPITTAIVLGASNLHIVMITVVSALSTIVAQSQVGRLVDRVGPVSLIKASRFLFVLVPLAYGFANNLLWIYLVTAVMGVPAAIVNISFNAHIMDVAPPRKHAEYFGIFNGGIGLASFAGSLLGGYAARGLQAVWPGNLWLALLVVYLVSMTGRAAGAFLTLKIHDPTSYPESADEVWRRFQHYFANGHSRGPPRSFVPFARSGTRVGHAAAPAPVPSAASGPSVSEPSRAQEQSRDKPHSP
ncbi:MAG TPA: MFS transporter, partial [Thermoplasmata archaeon]|nr:MFS transporter [Thermoplasmata archaeon]